MVYFRDDTNLTVPSAGIEVPIAGQPFRFFIALAVDTVLNQLTGQAVTVTVYGGKDGTEQMTVAYGQSDGRWFHGKWFKVVGNGAIIELKAATESMTVRAYVIQKTSA